MSQTSHNIPLLVVDDDPDILTYIDNILPQRDYTLFFARNGKEALVMLEEQHFGIIMADIGIPEMDGISLCRHIRSNDYTNYIYMLLISARSEEEEIASGIRAGADDFLAKPFGNIDLLAKLHLASRTLRLYEELNTAKQALVEQSLLDPLTHVSNRRHFMKQLRHDVFRAERYRHPLSVVLCNIDNMTSINDQYGNNTGDVILQQLAQNLQERVRAEIDTISRIDGDEFALLLPETKTAHAMTVAQRIRSAVAESNFEVLGQKISITARLGVAGVDRVDSETHNPDAIISYAKYFLGQGKSCGGNTTAGLDISSE